MAVPGGPSPAGVLLWLGVAIQCSRKFLIPVTFQLRGKDTKDEGKERLFSLVSTQGTKSPEYINNLFYTTHDLW